MKLSDILSSIALIVAIASAIFTYIQTDAAKTQLRLADLQIRPYVKYIPIFLPRKDRLDIEMHSEDLSGIPAQVVYSSFTPWIDGVNSGAFLINRTGDILYEHRGGDALVPEMPSKTAHLVMQGRSRLEIGSCVVYGSISPQDKRRWEVRAFYSYEPGEAKTVVEMDHEIEVSASTRSCESRNLRSEWVASHRPCPECPREPR